MGQGLETARTGMKIIRVNDTAALEPTLALESVKYDRTFVFFFGAELEESGLSWCPDCIIADPKVRKWISKVSNCLLSIYISIIF